MIIDSSEYWASELKALLEAQGLSVPAWHTKGTGWFEGLKNPALKWVFIEDQLPSRSGLQCIEKMAESSVFEGHVVFMHSLQGGAAAALECLAYTWGVRFVLRKPFRPAELRKMLALVADVVV